MSTLSALLNTPRPSEEHALGLPEADGQTRRYRGRSIDELIPKIEAELGVDAIVVRRRRGLEGGIGGFFQRPYVEIEAKPGGPRIDVYDEDPELRRLAVAPAPLDRAQAPTDFGTLAGAPDSVPAPALRRPAGAYVTDTLATIAAAGAPESTVEDPPRPRGVTDTEGFRELTPESLAHGARAAQDHPEPSERLADTFATALAAAEQQTPHLPAGSQPSAPTDAGPLPPSAPTEPLQPAVSPSVRHAPLESELERIEGELGELHAMRPQVQRAAAAVAIPRWGRARASIERSMTGLGVSEELARELIDSAIAHAIPFAPRIGLARAVHGALVARIPVNPLLGAQRATIAVVGAGGAGKTSCCAALLGAYRRAGTLPASCASIMLEPERERPSMLLSPYVMEPSAIRSARAREALAEARREGLLLLDMPPLSPAERPSIRLIASLLEELEPDRVVVALPATLGARAAAQLLEALRPLRASALAITHADETDQIGVAVEAACAFGLAPEYLLDRGRLRGGLTRIDPTHLADRLMP
jgi:hypothetical protein